MGLVQTAGSGLQAGPVLQTSPNGCEEVVRQRSQLERLPELQLAPWLGDLLCTLMHSMGEGDNKIGQGRGYPNQNPIAGWTAVLGTFYLISPRSRALSKCHLKKYSEDFASKNYWSCRHLRRPGEDLVLQLSKRWQLNMETYFPADSKYKPQVGAEQTKRPISPSSCVPDAVFS